MIRDKLDDRRTAEQEILALHRQIERCEAVTLPDSYPQAARPVKVPGKDEYTYNPRGTNNPQAMVMQQEDGYRQTLLALLEAKHSLLLEAEEIIVSHPDGQTRVILRYYYCQAWTDEQIAAELESSSTSINARRNAAVKWLDENYPDDLGEIRRKAVESGGASVVGC